MTLENTKMKNFDEILDVVDDHPIRTIAVGPAEDASVLQAVEAARKRNIAKCLLVGNEQKIREIAAAEGLTLPDAEIVDCKDELAAAQQAVELAANGQAHIAMKGMIHTDDFLRAVLNKEKGLRIGVTMSHVFIVEDRQKDKLIFVSDAAMNIAPDLQQKAEIVLNVVHLAECFGVPNPRVAILAAVEVVNPAMPATVDAAVLAAMCKRRQFSPKCVIDGPFAFDNAISEEAARHKKIEGPVAGNADILITPDVESGNMLVKSMVFMGGRRAAGILMGTKAPVVLTSRADSAESKALSMACAVLLVNVRRELSLKIGKVHY